MKQKKTENTINSIMEEPILKKTIDISLRGKYLPNILVKLGLFPCNADARKHIRIFGVVVDFNKINDIDYQLKEYNLIEWKDIVYKVRIL